MTTYIYGARGTKHVVRAENGLVWCARCGRARYDIQSFTKAECK